MHSLAILSKAVRGRTRAPSFTGQARTRPVGGTDPAPTRALWVELAKMVLLQMLDVPRVCYWYPVLGL